MDIEVRAGDLDRIDALLAGRSRGGPGLVLRGDPGVGKTALLRAAAARAGAAGTRVLWVSGAPFEYQMSFSALHQLVSPLRLLGDRLAGRHRDALAHVLGLGAGPPPRPLVIAAAVHALLRAAATERPLLVLLDDVPWIDPASATVLGFCVRRTGDDPIRWLAAARTGAGGPLDQAGLPEREIGPLAEQPAARLLDTRHPDLAPPVRRRVLTEAAGIPLVLEELPASLTEGQRSGRDPLPAFLPLNRRLRAWVTGRLRALPAPAREQLLLAALHADADAGLPLLRSAVVPTAAPDEGVAGALHEAALAAWRHEALSVAVAALVRAGELSPHPADRSRRLAEAAFLATMTGQFDEVPRLVAAADRPSGLVLAATAHLLSAVEGDVDAANHLLARALDDVGEAPGTWDAHGILLTLLLIGVYGARPERWALLDAALDRFAADTVAPFRLCHQAFVDPARTAGTVRAGLADAFAALPADVPPWQVLPLAHAAAAMDALAEYRYVVRRMVERERDGGAVTLVVAGLLLLCLDSYGRGQWDEAEAMAREGLDLATAHRYHLLEGQHRVSLAYIAAGRGNAEPARILDEVTTWAAPRRVGMTHESAGHTRVLMALGRGDYEAAYAQASRITPPGGPNAGVPGRWTLLDLVEAAVRTGRTAEARAHVAAAERAGIDRISTRTALITAGAAALAAGDERAGGLFEAALALPEAGRWPFEQARIQLAFGQWLRRGRDTARARLHLRAAAETLDRLGARPWATRAHHELRATGIAAGPAAGGGSALTGQERQIATLAATGLTNKQIGERLHLSHRTVGAHLRRIFPKLGIASRAALRDALGS
ncbi:AAA family ATPase [Dactylosporangium sp. CS-047395]|uniref:helix-turn-helix transcriptional regulator n=1 Tax=Dactylosporangium sp. CS-047395 TaxID=3239936 RepID=UPI003D90FC87